MQREGRPKSAGDRTNDAKLHSLALLSGIRLVELIPLDDAAFPHKPYSRDRYCEIFHDKIKRSGEYGRRRKGSCAGVSCQNDRSVGG